ncbi:7754_t:CDS:2, partial [Racocetra fulgida]
MSSQDIMERIQTKRSIEKIEFTKTKKGTEVKINGTAFDLDALLKAPKKSKKKYNDEITNMITVNEEEADKIKEIININLDNTSKEDMGRLVEQSFILLAKIFFETAVERMSLPDLPNKMNPEQLSLVLYSYKNAKKWEFGKGDTKLTIEKI